MMMGTRLWYKKPAALKSLSTKKHGVIEASAGTGKTYTLQHLLVEILLTERVTIDQILLVTFTVAATSDLKKKIREILEELVQGWEFARARGYAQALLEGGEVREVDGVAEPDDYWAIDLEGIQALRRGLRSFDRASIHTIHGFCQRVLTEHAFQNRRLFDQEHVSEDEVINEAFARMLREDIRPGTAAQESLTGFLGEGKKLDDLKKQLKDYVKCVGEYRPAGQGVLEEFDKALQRFVSAFERFDAQSWDARIKELGAKGQTIKAMNGRFAFIESYLHRPRPASTIARLIEIEKLYPDSLEYLTRDAPQRVLQADPALANAVLEMTQFVGKTTEAMVAVFGELLRSRMQQLKEEEGYFTFDDMVKLVRDRLVEEGEGGALLSDIRAQYRFGLIDEFQDTDPGQWEIFRRIFVEGDEGHRLYLIGDPKQAIYGFRGGDVATYLAAREHLRSLGCGEAQLADNYRSTPQVIGAYNAIFDGEHDPVISLGEGIDYPKGGVGAGKKWLRLKTPSGGEAGVTLMELKTAQKSMRVDKVREGVARGYAAKIRQVLEQKWSFIAGEDGEEVPVGARDIYILARRGDELQLMAEALRAEGVPFAFMKLDGLFQRPEAEDIYDLLLAIAAPSDRSRRARAWMTPFFDLSLGDLEGLAEIGEETEIYRRLQRWSRLGEAREWGRLFAAVVEESGLIRRRLFLARGERELTNYLHLLEIMAQEAARRVWTVEELAQRLKAFIDGRQKPDGDEGEQQRLETEEEAVQLLTMHASKGLQRGLVFVFPKFSGISEKPPFRFHDGETLVEWHAKKDEMDQEDQARYEAEETAEELRLAYVALTRAELQIFMPYAEEGSAVYKTLRKDPFTQIIDRVAGLQGQPDLAPYFTTHVVDLDEAPQKVSQEEVRASLEAIQDGAKIVFPEEAKNKNAEAERRELMGRRWEVTSYSKLKRRGGPVVEEEEKGGLNAQEAAGDLPGGMGTGNFLHLVMEELDYLQVTNFSREEWISDEELRAFFKSRGRRYGSYDRAAISQAMGHIYDTLRSSVVLPGGDLVDGLWRLEEGQLAKEREFLFPIAQMGKAGLERSFLSGAQVRAGFVTGVIDLLFEWEGRIYFADWKSDLSNSYRSEALERLVELRYAEQAYLYTLAVCRMLGVNDEARYEELFGGYCYFFMRGLRPEALGEGIYSGRLGWDELVSYERELFDEVEATKLGWGAREEVAQ